MDNVFKLKEHIAKVNRHMSIMKDALNELEDVIVKINNDENYHAILEEVWVVYNQDLDLINKLANNRDVILYETMEEALEDVFSGMSRPMMACDIPMKWRNYIINQLKHS
jgi:5,10-methylene-tetrahydrofolate dehydrogenase/methenyl tetrahydrofolate cyclohydrolase